MSAQGIVTPPGQGPVSSFTPGRAVVLKLLGGTTDDSTGSVLLPRQAASSEQRRRTGRKLSSMSERELAEICQRHGWAFLGPTPL